MYLLNSVRSTTDGDSSLSIHLTAIYIATIETELMLYTVHTPTKLYKA